jgi:protoheme ferro-lyase
MSLDKNGSMIKKDDIVTIHCKVITTYPGNEDYNNVLLETVEEHFPSNEYTKIILNTKQVQKVK